MGDDYDVLVMITRLIWMTWTSMSAVRVHNNRLLQNTLTSP